MTISTANSLSNHTSLSSTKSIEKHTHPDFCHILNFSYIYIYYIKTQLIKKILI